MSQNRLVAKHYWLNPGPWYKPSESAKRSAREHYAGHVARTAFQITGAVLFLIRSFPRLNGPFLIRCVSSMPAMVIEAHRKRFNPSIGPKQRLIVRWSCSNRLISGMCRRDTQIRVSWSLGINFRWASDWGVGSGGQAAIFATGCGFFFFLRKKISARGTGSKKCNVNEVIFIDFASTTSILLLNGRAKSRAIGTW